MNSVLVVKVEVRVSLVNAYNTSMGLPAPTSDHSNELDHAPDTSNLFTDRTDQCHGSAPSERKTHLGDSIWS